MRWVWYAVVAIKWALLTAYLWKIGGFALAVSPIGLFGAGVVAQVIINALGDHDDYRLTPLPEAAPPTASRIAGTLHRLGFSDIGEPKLWYPLSSSRAIAQWGLEDGSGHIHATLIWRAGKGRLVMIEFETLLSTGETLYTVTGRYSGPARPNRLVQAITTRTITVEALYRQHTEALTFLAERGVVPVRREQPYWEQVVADHREFKAWYRERRFWYTLLANWRHLTKYGRYGRPIWKQREVLARFSQEQERGQPIAELLGSKFGLAAVWVGCAALFAVAAHAFLIP